MNHILRKVKDKWKILAGMTAMLSLVFVGFLAFYMHDKSYAADEVPTYTVTDSEGSSLISGTYSMRMAADTFTIQGATSANTTYEWTCPNEDVLQISNGTATYGGSVTQTGITSSIRALVKKPGTVALQVTITNNDTGNVQYYTMPITVLFSINESMTNTDTIHMDKIYSTDARKALVMDYGTSLGFGTSAVNETGKLNLTYGSASDAYWTSSNRDVLQVGTNSVTATGAGRATLTVSYSDGIDEYTDSITVYVRPQITVNGTTVSDSLESVVMSNGDSIDVSAKFQYNPLEAISSKVVWVIAKDVGSDTLLVRDSLGNYTEDYKDEAKLVFQPASGTYKLDAKAGTYKVLFYVAGTYTSYDAAQSVTPGCAPTTVGGNVKVLSNYNDKTVSVNIGGTYSLADSFNITAEALYENFDVVIETTPDSNQYISLTTSTMVISANALGTGVVHVSPKSTYNADIPGLDSSSGEVTVTINVSESFSLNVSQATMAVGSTQTLYGIFGSGVTADSTQFTWSTDDTDETYITLTPNGQYATITAKKATQTNQSVKVTLKWTSDDGITLTASCSITVNTTITEFTINADKTTIDVGGFANLTTVGADGASLTWLSSDTTIATVDNMNTSGAGTPKAQVTGIKAGTVVITALNSVNNVYATCKITVTQPIESLSIGVDGTAYDAYSTTLSKGFVFMTPMYTPEDATDTNFTWSIEANSGSNPSDPESIATIDQYGTVTLLAEGDVYINLDSEGGAHAYCHLVIQSNPMTSITTDVSTLNMIKGDSYTVTTSYLPEDASDTNMEWQSTDETVATVNAGVITAVSPGTTSIIVSSKLSQTDGSKAQAIITVNVRNRLTSIAFSSKSEYVAVGGSKTVTVTFTPSESVNTNLTWSSSDTSIFTVSSDGTIKGVKEGVAMLSCVAEDLGQSGAITCMVYVTSSTITATDFAISPIEDTVYIGSTLQMTAIFTPEDTTDQDVTWASSDETKATVDANGVVTGVAEGSCVITATYMDTNNDNKTWTKTCMLTVEKAPVSATDFTVTPETKNIIVGDKFTITPVFTPTDTTNQNVVYQSMNVDVVTVTDKGKVTGVGAGDALIQCQAEDGGFIATVAVHVDNAIEFKLSPSTRELALGHSFTLKKVTKPTNAKKTATWKSSNTTIATVSSSGKVTAKKIGTCKITCTLTKYNQSATCKIKVRKLKTSVKLNKSSIRIGIGQTYRLKKTVTSNAGKLPGVTWRTSNKRVLTVNSNGKIKARRAGLATVTVMTTDSIHAKARCKVRVIQRATSIRLNTNYMVCYIGRTKVLRATVKPSTASIKKVKWTSSNRNIVQVNGSGHVNGIAEGDAYITATTTDGSNKKAKCFVKVMEEVPVTSIVVAQTDITMKRGDSTKLSYTALPSNTSDSIKFASDNKRVATVNSKGVVKAVGTGNANITIMSTSGVTTTVTVNVVALNKTTLNIRQYDTETLIVLGTSSTVTWYSSNTRIATVSGGKVIGKGKGTAYIYAYVNGCKLGCKVTITSVND